jgi:L-lactate dehydrogenase complex protein LldG
MSDADRARLLADVRRALGRREPAPPAPLEAVVDPSIEETSGELVARFTHELAAVGGQVSQARDAEELSACVADICRRAAAREVALSGAPLLAEMNLAAQLAARQLAVRGGASFEHPDRAELIAQLAGCDAGVTAAEYAIAETGTLALSSDEPHALLVSLLPPIHIAVLRPQQIRLSLAEVITQLPARRPGHAAIRQTATFITGPSRTGDIELTLSVGVHGPKELHVVILSE